mgnify:CR=1 FL=1
MPETIINLSMHALQFPFRKFVDQENIGGPLLFDRDERQFGLSRIGFEQTFSLFTGKVDSTE